MKKYTWLISIIIMILGYLVFTKIFSIRIEHHVFGPLITGAILGFGSVYIEKSLSKYFLKKERKSYY
ncbi:MAG: hypothetical protein RR565_04950 [Erysipelothrix sp.]